MARTRNLFMILPILLLVLAFPYASADTYAKQSKPSSGAYAPPTKPYTPPEKQADVVVEGIVYCQSCNYSGTWSLNEAEPIVGATVSVICRNYKQRISYYNSFKTSNGGYFYAKLDSFSMRHNLLDHPLQACAVKLVSSPVETCDVFTNVNYGINGAPLKYEKKKIMTKNYQAVIYSAGPLAFRPDHCAPKPY